MFKWKLELAIIAICAISMLILLSLVNIKASPNDRVSLCKARGAEYTGKFIIVGGRESPICKDWE